MLWGLLNRWYLLPIHTEVWAMHCQALSSWWHWGTGRQSLQSKTEPEARGLSWYWWLLHWSPATAGKFDTGVGGSRTWACPALLNHGGLFSSHFFLSALFCLPVSKKVLFKEELSCKELQRKQEWSALLNRGTILCAAQYSTEHEVERLLWGSGLLFSISHLSLACREQSSIPNQSCQKGKMLQTCCGSPVGVEGREKINW